MEYRPTFSSFAGSTLYGLSPAILAAIVIYFWGDSLRLIMWVLSGFMVLLSLFFFLQSIFVYLQKVYLDDYSISVSGPLMKISIRWEDIVSAVLRERENAMSRTDHLLVLKSAGNMLTYNTSTLSDEDDRKVLEIVGKKTNLVVQKDKPTI